jgi:hypothetical protein
MKVIANPVKYHDIEYHDNYIVVTQNQTRRRIYKGWYFEDTGTHIYISTYYSNIFQCKTKTKAFWLDLETKEWKPYIDYKVEKHTPEKLNPIESNFIKRLKKDE